MALLYKYIFYKVYFFYINKFKEKEIPHWFAAGIITLILVSNIVVVIDILSYITYPEINKKIDVYYKYFALFVLLIVLLFINYKNRYKQIISTCENLPESKKTVLGYISIAYVLVVFVCFFWISELIREYNYYH